VAEERTATGRSSFGDIEPYAARTAISTAGGIARDTIAARISADLRSSSATSSTSI
jgi:hypothetical protein